MSAARPGHGQHLDATSGREVVFCHNCSNEWYRDEQGLECPRCRSEITEVVDPAEDPRDLSRSMPTAGGYPSSASTSPERHVPHNDGDSDPDEADIEEHLGPHGFRFSRSTSQLPSGGHFHHHHHHAHNHVHDHDHDHDHDHGHHHHHHHHHPHDLHQRRNPAVDPVLQRFADMLQGFGPTGRGGGQSTFGTNGHTVQRTTFTSRTTGGGTASVTIFSGPAPGFRGQNADTDPFQSFFNSTMQDMNQQPGDQQQGNNERGPPVGFGQSLQEILNLFNPANAAVGDAVYSQEALDRIITSLMEQNPQSNAAPPASDEALQNLDRRPVTTEMIGPEGKSECAICIDNFEEGQTAAFLPCKHWFHEECVVLWLKEHNTCPVCRTPIETRQQSNASASGGNNNGGNGEGTQASPEGSSGTAPPQGQPDSSRSQFPPGLGFMPGGGWQSSFQASQHPQEPRVMFYRFGSANAPTRPTMSRPPSQSQTPLNQVMRDISSAQHEQRARDREAASDQPYDTSRFQQRRTSLSPTAPRAYSTAEMGARMRQRSPSSSERRRTPDREDSNRGSSAGAFGWLRDRLGGSQRDGRRS